MKRSRRESHCLREVTNAARSGVLVQWTSSCDKMKRACESAIHVEDFRNGIPEIRVIVLFQTAAKFVEIEWRHASEAKDGGDGAAAAAGAATAS